MRPIALATTAVLVFAPAIAAAECLPEAARDRFEQQLRARFLESTLSIDQLEAHAADRLGFGARAREGAPRASDQDRRIALARRIANSLAGAAAISGAIDTELAQLQTTRPAGRSPYLYRHAAMSMTDSYSEYAEALEAMREETDPVRRLELRRVANQIRADQRDAPKARVVAHLTLSGEPDAGELLGEFWSNHFNVTAHKTTWAMVDYQKSLRRRICGTFRELLETSAKHPAMSIYLDNFRSRAGMINENYGRELLELHTFGDDRLRYYTQQDVVGVARALTGWGVGFEEIDADTTRPRFEFFRASHDPARLVLFANAPLGTRLVLEAARTVGGVPVAGAISRGEQLLDYLADHPGTQRNICAKLARRLIGPGRGELIDGCVAVWGQGGDLGAIYRYFITSYAMWNATPPMGVAAQNAYQVKYKNPLELVTSANRRMVLPRATVISVRYIHRVLGEIGQLGLPVADVPPPTGYDDDNSWLSAGELLSWTPIVFSGLDVANLRLRLADGSVIGGADLEAYVRAEVTRAEGLANPDFHLHALGHRLAWELLGYPEQTAIPRAAVLGSFRDADRRGARAMMVPSFVHTAIAATPFLRK